MGITRQGPGAMPPGPRPRPRPPPRPRRRDTPDHTTGSVCSVPRFWLQADPSSSRPRAQASPGLISRPLPSRGGVMQCGKATSQEGKDVQCCVKMGCGIDAAVAHVRRRRIQGCLIRQVMIAKNLGGTGKGELGRTCEAAAGGAASKQASRRAKARFSFPQPAPAIPAWHVFLLLLPVIHSRRVGEARQGNVRQCKARQGNKAVLVHAPDAPAPPAAATRFLLLGPTVLAQSAAFGTRAARGRRRHDETTRQASGCLALPQAGQNAPGPLFPLPRYRVVVRSMDGMFTHNPLC